MNLSTDSQKCFICIFLFAIVTLIQMEYTNISYKERIDAMAYDVKLIGAKLRRWENYLDNFRLPQWD